MMPSYHVFLVEEGKPFSSAIPELFTKVGSTAPCGVTDEGTVLWQYWRTNPETDESYFITEEDFLVNKKRVRRLVCAYYP